MFLTKTLISTILALVASSNAQLAEKQFSQYATDQQNVLRYLGGTGPFVEPVGFGISTDTPYQCTIDQAHLFMRHGERFPTKGTGKSLEKFYQKFKNATESFDPTGPLAFVKELDSYFAPSEWHDQETFSGPYAGTGDAFTLGNNLRKRYSHLVNTSKPLPIFSSGQKRVFDTAINFAQGFTFNEYAQNFTMVVIPENQDYGVNSLTNTNSCPNFDGDYAGPLANLSLSYKSVEAARLNALSPGFNITEEDVFNIMNYCGFELDVRGSSKFCDVVTQDTVLGFGYEKDVNYYYTNGPGYNMSYVSGSTYANATATLLKDNNTENNLYFSFSHDNDLLRYLTFLGLVDVDEDLPVDHVKFYKFFSASTIVPMGGRLITERLSCYNETTQADDKFVRFLLNDQVIPFPDCSSGPGYSCPLDTYLDIIDSQVLDFPALCDMNSSTPQYLSFYWDWESGKYPISYD